MPCAAAVVADRLRDGEDVRLVERARERRAAVAAGAEAHALRGILQLGLALEIGALERGEVHQHLAGRGLAGER